MALSQLQCLDDNHVNPRILESKPEFLYCEDQRLALEALLQNGREAFAQFLESRGLRGFLSDPEQETLTGSVEPYDPGSELYPADAEDDEPPLSLQYWPELSDTSVPQMDLGWPDCASYRGVTRTNVYAQPPLDGRMHIKEIVRKTIAQAQKVIAVVMDVFTDVDIFRDLLDAGFKRRVSVYILLERTALPHFLSMCQRANMHAGHLKNLRVRCAGGAEFHTRSCSRVQGRLGHRFMFVDGDKAVSGSYSFTWMSSRLDKHLITVVTGQAVNAFDWLFRSLYMTSSTVDLRQIATDTEPEPEPLPQPATVALPSAALARKLYNPKYALVSLGDASLSPASSSGHNSPKDSQDPVLPETKKGRRRKAIKDAPEAPPLHPGLANLEKAYLMPYLPTWPEPDPPSDVIGFINIRNANRPTQVHLQRSERFETSQAIRFSSPFNKPEETLPEVAQPRQFTAQCDEMCKVQPTKPDIKPEQKVQKSVPNTHTADLTLVNTHTSTHTSASEPETETLKREGNIPALNTKHNLSPNTPTSHDATPHLSTHTPRQSSATAATLTPTHTVTTNTPKPQPLPVSNKKHTRQTKPSLNTHAADTSRTHPLLPHMDLQSLPQSPSKKNTSSPTTTNNHIASSSVPPVHSVSSTSPSENTPITTVPTPFLPSSYIPSPSTPPVPKPRTVQLVIKSSGSSGGLDQPEVSVVATPGCLASTEPLVSHNETRGLVTEKEEKEAKTAPELQNNSGTKTGVQTDIEKNLRKSGGGCFVAQQTQSGSTQEVEGICGLQNETATGAKLQGQSDILITSTPQTDIFKEMMPRKVETKTVTLTDPSITPKPQTHSVSTLPKQTEATARPPTGCESAEAPNEDSANVTRPKTYPAKESQRILYYVSKPQNKVPLESVASDTHTHKHNSTSGTHAPEDSVDGNTHTSASDAADSILHTHTQQGQPSVTSRPSTHDGPTHHTDAANHSTHTDTFQESQKSPNVKGCLCLELRSATPERDPRSHMPVFRNPAPERPLPSTLDSRTHTPDPRSYTLDVRTPTSDVSDGYLSTREDSTLSTTSEEYYECSDEPVFDRGVYHSHWLTEDNNGITHTNSATTTGKSTSSSETESLSGASTATRVSSSSLLEKILKEEGETNEKNGQKEEEKGRKISVVEKSNRAERASSPSQGAERRGSQLSLTNKRTERERPEEVSSGRERAAEPAALGPSGAEKRDSAQAARETEGKKPMRTPPRPPRGHHQQQDSKAAPQSRPSQTSRPPRPYQASQPPGGRPGGSRPSKVAQSSPQVLDNTLSACRLPSSPDPPPPAAVGVVGAGRRQSEVSPNQHSSPYRQPPAVQGRVRAGQTQSQPTYPKPQASFLHTHSNLLSKLHPQPQLQSTQNQAAMQAQPSARQGSGAAVGAGEAPRQEEGKTFGIYFSRLHSLKGLKDRKRSSSNSPAQGRKSTG